MPSHQERIRKKNPEINCGHIWIYKEHSDIAPFILESGLRRTIRICIDCGIEESWTRTQEEFEDELRRNIANKTPN